jgi:hypothetical protein
VFIEHRHPFAFNCMVPAQKFWRLFGAIEVFREGAENGTRGACAPHFRFLLVLRQYLISPDFVQRRMGGEGNP